MSEEVVEAEKKEPTVQELEAQYKTMCMQLGNEMYSFWLQSSSHMMQMQRLNLKGAELKGEIKDDTSK